VLEHVHNVLGLRNAEHQELAPDAPVLAVTALAAPDQPGHDLRLEY